MLRPRPVSDCDCMWKCNNRYSDSGNSNSRYFFKIDTNSQIHTEAETGFRAATACGNATTVILTQATATANTLLKLIQILKYILRSKIIELQLKKYRAKT